MYCVLSEVLEDDSKNTKGELGKTRIVHSIRHLEKQWRLDAVSVDTYRYVDSRRMRASNMF